MLPSILAKQLEKGIGDYIETTFPMTNAPFKGSIRNMLATKDSVYHEPYVSVRLPFRVADAFRHPFCHTIQTFNLSHKQKQKSVHPEQDARKQDVFATGELIRRSFLICK